MTERRAIAVKASPMSLTQNSTPWDVADRCDIHKFPLLPAEDNVKMGRDRNTKNSVN